MAESDADEIIAAFDGPASIILLMKLTKKMKNGRLVGSAKHGNVCTVHCMVNEEVRTHVAADVKELSHEVWAKRLPRLLREEFAPAKAHVMGWTLSTRRFYNLQPGDLILDTRTDVKYAVVPSRRKKTGRRVRRKTEAPND